MEDSRDGGTKITVNKSINFNCNNEMLKYNDYYIVLQEVPDEISLALSITECPHHCVGCHSAYLAESFGRYVKDDLDIILNKYKDMITCVCFMGGDQHMDDLRTQLQYIKERHGLKTCVYSGADTTDIFESCFPYLDYFKIGHYDKNKGALDNCNTNQRFYAVRDRKLEDITHRFWKEIK